MDIEKILEEEIHPRANDYACGRGMAMVFKPLTVDDVYDAYMAGAETALRMMNDFAHNGGGCSIFSGV